MTEREKTSLVNAFFELRQGPDLVTNLADFHRDFANFDGTSDPDRRDIHKNLPDEPERDVFLPWHRMQMFEMEQAMQDIDANLSIPFLDWTIENSPEAELWDNDFMGQFNEIWDLGREYGARGNLPGNSDILFVQTFSSDFLIYSDRLERGTVHAGPHVWTGGWMGGPASPRDPVFYLHHTFIDRLWQQWEENNENSSFISTSMLRYDGTFVFNGKSLPLINPNNIVDSKSLGVFYAENQLAVLHDYSVSNSFRALEKFYYQYTIEVGDAFFIEDGKNARIESRNEVLLKPGFFAANGSNFMASIDISDPLKSIERFEKNDRDLMPFEDIADYESDFYLEEETVSMGENESLKVYPNPFSERIVIESETIIKDAIIEIFDMYSRRVFIDSVDLLFKMEINNIWLQPGIYILKIQANGKELLISKIVKM
jgi:tyrosinase